MACIFQGLEDIHTNGILHKDIKPANLIFDHNWYLRISDFGISKDILDGRKREGQDAGTFGYMAPEVIFKLYHSKQCDYFAVGVIMHEFLTGSRPYNGNSRDEYKAAICATKAAINTTNLDLTRFGNYKDVVVDFTNQLILKDPRKRLGAKGIHEIKNHPFFEYFNW